MDREKGIINMEYNLQKLYNTMLTIETKGESTVVMASCLQYTKELIRNAQEIADAYKADIKATTELGSVEGA